MMREDAVVGVTSNPTIFQKAISHGDALRRAAEGAARARDRPEGDLPAAVGARRRGSARPARAGAREERRGRLRLVGGRPDARVRPRGDVRRGDAAPRVARPAEPLREDPGDEAGPRRDRGLRRARQEHQRHAHLLARSGYAEVVEAYIRGLERLVAGGGSPKGVYSVASFFVSRVDTEADKRLEAIGSKDALALRGKLAVANAKLAYEHYRGRRSPARAGSSSPARARTRSAACGRRRRRRIPRTATSCTSRS